MKAREEAQFSSNYNNALVSSLINILISELYLCRSPAGPTWYNRSESEYYMICYNGVQYMYSITC